MIYSWSLSILGTEEAFKRWRGEVQELNGTCAKPLTLRTTPKSTTIMCYKSRESLRWKILIFRKLGSFKSKARRHSDNFILGLKLVDCLCVVLDFRSFKKL